MKKIKQVKLINQAFEVPFEKEINKFCLSHDVVDIKYQYDGNWYHAMIIYEIEVEED